MYKLNYEQFTGFWINRWATKVLVNSDEACDHGRKVGFYSAHSTILNHLFLKPFPGSSHLA